MKAVICGSRDTYNAEIYNTITRLAERFGITEIVLGGVEGVCHVADMWGSHREIPRIFYLPEFEKYGRLAGPVRNKRTLNECKPDLVIAFPEGGRDSENMISQAVAQGVPVFKVQDQTILR